MTYGRAAPGKSATSTRSSLGCCVIITDRAKFISQIVAEPRDTTLRGVFADWLDEHDDPQWAHLIRSSRTIDLHSRTPALYYLDGETVLFRLPEGVGGVVRNGFVDEIMARFTDLFRKRCLACIEWPGRAHNRGADDAVMPTHCGVCDTNTGEIPGIATDLFKRHPITRVTLTDCPIWPSGWNNTFYVGNLVAFPQKYWRRMEGLRSQRDAERARSDAAVSWGRELAGLPPLE